MTPSCYDIMSHKIIQDVEAFQLSESDLKFVKTPEENITAAMSDNERYPIVVMDGRQCVAFFTYIMEKGWLRHLAITKMQYFFSNYVLMNVLIVIEGSGKVVMEKLASFITSTFQDINEIVLTVNTDNDHAIRHFIANKDINIWEIVCSSGSLFILWR